MIKIHKFPRRRRRLVSPCPDERSGVVVPESFAEFASRRRYSHLFHPRRTRAEEEDNNRPGSCFFGGGRTFTAGSWVFFSAVYFGGLRKAVFHRFIYELIFYSNVIFYSNFHNFCPFGGMKYVFRPDLRVLPGEVVTLARRVLTGRFPAC